MAKVGDRVPKEHVDRYEAEKVRFQVERLNDKLRLRPSTLDARAAEVLTRRTRADRRRRGPSTMTGCADELGWPTKGGK
jgi:Spy/CpxP family protein refolding chaperone